MATVDLGPRRGRPRDQEKDAAIIDATWEVLSSRGYEGLAMDAVADVAGCSRSTIYRRFASKIELVEAMLRGTAVALMPPTGESMSLRDTLIAYAAISNDYLAPPRRQAMLSMIEAASRLPELAAILDDYMAGQFRTYFLDIFQRLAPAGTSAETFAFVFDTLAGSITYHLTVRRRTLTHAQIAMLVDQALFLLKGDREGAG